MSRQVSASVPPAAELARLLAAHPRRAVVFTGAGMSTESGLPDFRSNGGLWKQNRRFEELASREALETDYDEHVAFYRWRIEMLAGARAQRRAPRGRRLAAARAGRHRRHAKRRWLSHARGRRRACWSCTARWRTCAAIAAATSVPPPSSWRRRASPAHAAARCRPGVVLFGEALPDGRRCARPGRRPSARRCSSCSARRCAVAPANLLPEAAVGRGAPLVIVNRDPTPLDGMATLVINAGIGETLRAVDRLLAPVAGRPGRATVAHNRRRAQVAVHAAPPPASTRPRDQRDARTVSPTDALAQQRRARARAARPPPRRGRRRARRETAARGRVGQSSTIPRQRHACSRRRRGAVRS